LRAPDLTPSHPSDSAFLSIEEVAPLLRKKKMSPVELVEAALARAELLNPQLNAFITIVAGHAREQARRAEREIARGRYRGPLHGIPITLKDNIITRGIRTTVGSKFFSPPHSAEEATVARRLAQAGTILIGKTNLHEFAYGTTTQNPYFGPARNPWDLGRVPGGSSGGSATALAAGIGFASIGSDTGGSIRIPSALCGTVGLKPTFGRVSCFGIVPLSRSLDHAGPLARTVVDAAIVLRAIAGYDPRDSFTPRKPVPDYSKALRGKSRGIRLGWPRDFFFEQVDGEIRSAVEAAAEVFQRLGAKIKEIDLPHLADSVEPSTNIALAEARHFHESQGFFPARASEYGEDVRQRLEQGGSVRAVDYLAALDQREQTTRDFDLALQKVDALLAPTVAISAPRLGETIVTIGGREETVRSALIRLNRPANFTGHPAISLPCGFTKAGLPIGLQLIGRKWDESRLLQVAHAYEQATDWHTRHPRENA
jgi:aspartyl-tRNA(Asn)/glutamyl-tRNA(Gln) amidotransferase subunit A